MSLKSILEEVIVKGKFPFRAKNKDVNSPKLSVASLYTGKNGISVNYLGHW